MKCRKIFRFISILLLSFSIFQSAFMLYGSYRVVKADELTATLGGACAVAPEMAPYILVAGALIAGGTIIYKNQDQIIATANMIKDKAVALGVNVGSYVNGQVLTMSSDIKYLIDSVKTDALSTYNISKIALDYSGNSGQSMPANYSNWFEFSDSTGTFWYYLGSNSNFSVYTDSSSRICTVGNADVYYIHVGYGGWSYNGLQSGCIAHYGSTDSFNGSVCVYSDKTLANIAYGKSVSVDTPVTIPWSTNGVDIDYPTDDSLTFNPNADVVGVNVFDSSKPISSVCTDSSNVIPANGNPVSTSTSTFPVSSLWDWLQQIIDAIKSIPTKLQNIWDWLKELPVEITQPIVNFFTVDWTAVSEATDYTPIFEAHFKPFYDITNLLENINPSTTSSSGKFYMVIPKAMGGNDQPMCVLDLTVGAVYINWARTILQMGMWIGFLWYILRLFSPRLHIS